MRSGIKIAIAAAAGGLAVWVGLRYLLPVLMPFALGAGLALAAEPGVRFLSRRLRLPRAAAAGLGVSAVFGLIGILITAVLAFLFRELGILARILPNMEVTIQDGLDALQTWLLELSLRASPGIRDVLQRNVTEFFSGGAEMLDQFTRYAIGLAGTLLSHLPGSALGLGTAVLSAFLISSELPRIQAFLEGSLSQGRVQAGLLFLRRLRATVGLWLVAQMKLIGITYLVLTLGFVLLKIAYAPLWALAIAAVDALPILGTGAVLAPWSLVCFLRGDTPRAIGLLGVYITAAIIRSTLEPRLIGRQLGLDPLVTLIALYTGFRLWGLPGMMLMPLLAITAIRMLPEMQIK